MARDRMRFNISTDDVDRAVESEFDRLDEALDETAQELRREGLQAAKNHIRKHDRIWNKEVLNNWVPVQTESYGVKMYGWQNYSDHANVVDKGATFTNKKPPLHKMLTYVMSAQTSFTETPSMSYIDWAFWLQDRIYRNGLEGIHYKRVAIAKIHGRLDSVLHEKVRRNTR